MQSTARKRVNRKRIVSVITSDDWHNLYEVDRSAGRLAAIDGYKASTRHVCSLRDDLGRIGRKCSARAASEYSEAFYRKRGEIVTRKAKSEVVPQVERLFRFVNVTLPLEESEHVEATYHDVEGVSNAWHSLMEKGYKVSFGYDAKTDAIMCSLTCKAEANPNYNATMTSFADSWYDALRVALYKHYQYLSGIWEKPGQKPQRPKFG